MDNLLLTVVFASVEATASRSSLTISAVPNWAANMSAVLLSWWKYYNYGNTISDIIINITHCNINYIPMQKYHIIIYNIKLYKKWLTVIQTKRERKRIIKRKSNRLREWTKKIRKELELERNKDTKREKKRKTIIYQKYVHAGDTKINKKEKKK